MTTIKGHSGFPCSTDLAFYQARRLPAWARDIKGTAPGVDAVVNAHAGVRVTSAEGAAHNLLCLLASAIRRGNLDATLLVLAKFPQCAISPEKRAAFARKWALRLGLQPAPYVEY